MLGYIFFFFFSSRRRHTRFSRDWSSDVCSSDLLVVRDLIGFKSSLDFADTGFEVVPGAESQDLFGLFEADAVIAAVGILNKLGAGLREDAKDDFGHLGKGVIQTVVTDVKDLPTDGTNRSVKDTNNGFGQIFNVDKWAPLLSIENGDGTVLIGPRGE